MFACLLQDNIDEIQIEVEPRFHRHFVVRRGEVLRYIAEEYGGVSVSFPRSGVSSNKVTLKGAKECVEGAKKRILEIVADLVSWWMGVVFCGGGGWKQTNIMFKVWEIDVK